MAQKDVQQISDSSPSIFLVLPVSFPKPIDTLYLHRPICLGRLSETSQLLLIQGPTELTSFEKL